MDNLFSNVCKYSLPGTRVYVTLEGRDGVAVLSVKNVSREALDMEPGELVERFVRGDQSRTTDGSGLGLSIAQSLTEAQGGRFALSIDGDLFKVDLRFDLI
jgi:signal transduction histidine kinase